MSKRRRAAGDRSRPKKGRGRPARRRSADRRPWFAVQSFFRSRPEGRPSHRDEAYVGGLAMIEERIILVRARSFEQALRRGKLEAREYMKGRSRNVYGQRVSMRLLRFISAYQLDDRPGDGDEVFSDTEIVSARESERSILDRRTGPEEGPSGRRHHAIGRMFMADWIARRLDVEVGRPERPRAGRAVKPMPRSD